MKKLFKRAVVLITASVLALGLFGCKNGFNESDEKNENSDYLLEVKLPEIVNRAVYYNQNDAVKYQVTIIKNNEQIDQKNGTPGSTVTFFLPEEGTYDVNVKAFNSNEDLIGEGTEQTTVSANT